MQNNWNNLDLQAYADTTSQVAKKIDARTLGRKMDAIETLKSNLDTNVQENLALEAAFIEAFA